MTYGVRRVRRVASWLDVFRAALVVSGLVETLAILTSVFAI